MAEIQGRGAVFMGNVASNVGVIGSTNATGNSVGGASGTTAASNNRGASKKTVLLQRAAGRCFYAWAIQVKNKNEIIRF